MLQLSKIKAGKTGLQKPAGKKITKTDQIFEKELKRTAKTEINNI